MDCLHNYINIVERNNYCPILIDYYKNTYLYIEKIDDKTLILHNLRILS